ncbi:MAG: hypothetical protein ABIC91_08955 [Nanoarchaeota archaeon]|nr:hypothetical protein [Nanoarchaeota archaeon]MBU1030251.1 hypothetical protein [Nanoarchaeota archaeon]MBU1850664.1 hypothetical protein [Nanoarchaeota archaeon]
MKQENKILENIGWTAKSFTNLFIAVDDLVYDIKEIKKSIDEEFPEESETIELEQRRK